MTTKYLGYSGYAVYPSSVIEVKNDRRIKRVFRNHKLTVPDPIQSGGKCMTIFFENLPIYSYMTQYHFRTSENSTLVKVTSKSQQRYLTTEWGDRNTSDRVSYFANIRNIGSSF